MRAARFDRRIRREARSLVREARAALARDASASAREVELEPAIGDLEQALAADDVHRLRRGIPRLDELVDDVGAPPTKSIARDYVESIGAAILIALCLRACVIEAFKIPSSSMYPTLEIGDHIFINKLAYGLRIPWTTTKLFARGPARGEVIVFTMPCDPSRDYIKRVVALAGDTVEVRCNLVYVNGVATPTQRVQAEGCAYDDHDDVTGTWFRRTCSRYVESTGGVSHATYHDPERPEREARFARGERIGADDRDFPRLVGLRRPPSCSTNPGQPVRASGQLPGALEPHGDRASEGACAPQVRYVVPPDHAFVMGDNRANSNDSRIWGSVPIASIKGRALFVWLSYSHWSPADWSGVRLDRMGNFIH